MSTWHNHYNSTVVGTKKHRHAPHCEIDGVDYCYDGWELLWRARTSYTEGRGRLAKAGWSCHHAFIHLDNFDHVNANAFLWKKGKEFFLTRELTTDELYNLNHVKSYESAVKRIEELVQEYKHGTIVGKIATIYTRHQKAILAAGAVWLFCVFGGE